ncbi:hypothetical protein, partial [Leeuwenhoekiella sp.]|uniref:hypothetical protein n=1 Tax=Leeuwenhoekiella sp. TaxID=1977054 RepID=UPI0032427223
TDNRTQILAGRKVHPSFSFGKLIQNHFTNLRAGRQVVSFASRQKKGIKDRSENFVSTVRILQISINGFAELRVYSEPREFDFVRPFGYGYLML